MSYTTIIGLEVHVQLLTKTKLFCGCVNRFNPANPNVQTCPVCLGLPGSLPVLNRAAIELAIKTGLALNCTIPPLTKWDRKQYYYPDLPKGYQISQYDLPISTDGWLEIATAESESRKRIGIIRAHLEEDAGKNLHDETGRGGDSLVDLNRAGTPLVEIVSHPDLRSGAEAHAYLDELELLLTYLEISDCNMQEGSLRCDANVNLHVPTEDGKTVATPIVEVKNLNSFRGVELAIEYEARRQFEAWQQTGLKLGDVAKETRGWDADRSVTFSQRGKEEASDYRYFPDPDLVPLSVDEEWKSRIRDGLCEFPADRRQRFQTQYQLSDYDASVIVAQGPALAGYFERVTAECGDAKQAANWVTQDVLREMKDRKLEIAAFPVSDAVLGSILKRIQSRQITTNSGRVVFAALLERDSTTPATLDDVERIIVEKSLAITSGASELEPIIETVLAANAKIVADFKGGKQQAIGALIGQVMRQAKGADPQVVREMLLKKLAAG